MVLKVHRCKAFTLVELMIVVGIIGILAVVSVPAYKHYVLNAKIAEAYTALGAIQKSQITAKAEVGSFITLEGGIIKTSGSPAPLSERFDGTGAFIWNRYLKGPISSESNSYFSFGALAGYTDPDGTPHGVSFDTLTQTFVPFDGGWDVGGVTIFADENGDKGGTVPMDNASLGVGQVPNEHWVVNMAVANFKDDLDGSGDEQKTWVIQILQDSDGSKVSGIIVMNRGS